MNIIDATERFEAVKIDRALKELLHSLNEHDADVLKNPLPYLEAAHDTILDLREALEGLIEIGHEPISTAPLTTEGMFRQIKTVLITKEDFDRHNRLSELLQHFKETYYD